MSSILTHQIRWRSACRGKTDLCVCLSLPYCDCLSLSWSSLPPVAHQKVRETVSGKFCSPLPCLHLCCCPLLPRACLCCVTHAQNDVLNSFMDLNKAESNSMNLLFEDPIWAGVHVSMPVVPVCLNHLWNTLLAASSLTWKHFPA